VVISIFSPIKAAPGGVIGSSAPIVQTFENKTYIITGNEAGQVQFYTVKQNDLSAAFELTFPKWGEISMGRNTSPAVADLNGDQQLDLAVGNSRGGIGLFTTNLFADGLLPTIDIDKTLGIQIFPNPTAQSLTIQFKQLYSANKTYKIFHSTGQVVLSGALKNTQGTIALDFLFEGIYFIEIRIDEYHLVKRFVKK